MTPPFETLGLGTLATAALVVAGAYVVFGLTGFGSTVVAVPLLAHVLPLTFAVPLIMLLDLAATVMLGARPTQLREHVPRCVPARFVA